MRFPRLQILGIAVLCVILISCKQTPDNTTGIIGTDPTIGKPAGNAPGAMQDTDFVPPAFSPSKEWSRHYIALLREAIKEKSGVDDARLDRDLMIVYVAQGQATDGFGMGTPREQNAVIHFIYRIDWALYNGTGFEFTVKDDSNNTLSDDEIRKNIEAKLPDIFGITAIEQRSRFAKCNMANLEPPWYSQGNRIIYISPEKSNPSNYTGGLVVQCRYAVDESANKCENELIDLRNGTTVYSADMACRVY